MNLSYLLNSLNFKTNVINSNNVRGLFLTNLNIRKLVLNNYIIDNYITENSQINIDEINNQIISKDKLIELFPSGNIIYNKKSTGIFKVIDKYGNNYVFKVIVDYGYNKEVDIIKKISSISDKSPNFVTSNLIFTSYFPPLEWKGDINPDKYSAMKRSGKRTQRHIYMSLNYCNSDLLKYMSINKEHGSYDPDKIIRYIFQILHGYVTLKYNLGLYHGDLSMRNILICDYDEADVIEYNINNEKVYLNLSEVDNKILKITDFGESKIINSDIGKLTNCSTKDLLLLLQELITRVKRSYKIYEDLKMTKLIELLEFLKNDSCDNILKTLLNSELYSFMKIKPEGRIIRY